MNIIVTLIDKQGNIVEPILIRKNSISFYGEDGLYLDSGKICTRIVSNNSIFHVAESPREINMRMQTRNMVNYVTLVDKHGNRVGKRIVRDDSILNYGEDTLFLDSGKKCTWIILEESIPLMWEPIHIAEPLFEIQCRVRGCHY